MSDSIKDILQVDVFNQLLEMDDSEDDREFSKSLYENFKKTTVQQIEEIDKQNTNNQEEYKHIADIGHALKLGAATIGFL